MILAAGRGMRMRHLTKKKPKPLLKLGHQAIIEHQLEAFAQAGVTEIIINICYKAHQFRKALSDGSAYGVKIYFSEEPRDSNLGTGGGIFRALPLLGDEPFILSSGDVWCDYPWQNLFRYASMTELAHLVMVDNPPYHAQGDYHLKSGSQIMLTGDKLTYGGIAVIHPHLFTGNTDTSFPLSKVLTPAIHDSLVTGEYYSGLWENIGTPEQLKAMSQLLAT